MSPLSRSSRPPDPAAPAGTRVCVGTSCVLRGGDRIAQALRARGPVETVPCLGFCDQSPAIMDLAGAVHTRFAAGPGAPGLRRLASGALASRVRALNTEPIVTRRIGAGDFASLSKAVREGAYRALDAAVRAPSARVVEAVEASGVRERADGAPVVARWRDAARAGEGPRIAVARGDEGAPGAFAHRLLLELDPHGVLEGLALSAYAVGANEALVFVRRENPRALERMERAVADAEAVGILGERVCGSAHALRVRVVRGGGQVVCDETALLNAIEGCLPEARVPPREPTRRGLWGRATVVHDAETLVALPWILERGPKAYAAIGTPHSRGTRALCLNAGFAAPGVVEVPYGVRLREVVEDAGATCCDETTLSGLLLGGPLGSLLRPDACDVPVCHAAMAERGVRLGHGGMIALDAGLRPLRLLRSLLHFAASGCCPGCAPSTLGARRALEILDERGVAGGAEIDRVLERMERTSLCEFGRRTPGPVRALLAGLEAEGRLG